VLLFFVVENMGPRNRMGVTSGNKKFANFAFLMPLVKMFNKKLYEVKTFLEFDSLKVQFIGNNDVNTIILGALFEGFK
jgi:hypothetical protein